MMTRAGTWNPRATAPLLAAVGLALALTACANPSQGPGPPRPCSGRGPCAGDTGDAAGGDADTGGVVDDPVCAPGDRAYCNHNGRCAVDGSACVCDVPDHYVPSDNCRDYYVTTRRYGDPCAAGSREQCNDRGTCGDDGWCVCDDEEHHSPVDDCQSSYDNPPKIPPPWDP